jgi:hypothetical protein
MYAQLIQGGTTPELRTRMDSIVTDDLIPALEAEPGYAGALNVIDRITGDALMIILWDTQAQANRELSDYGQEFLQALAKIAAITTGNRKPMSVWEVNACEVPVVLKEA